jgi:hypothetical protein
MDGASYAGEGNFCCNRPEAGRIHCLERRIPRPIRTLPWTSDS